ncbi:unnamed protein product [Phytophthora fragariaefolia]|uniref:Unnamed protein product n=1 Tax=Phytophthora fragariaefolia TaxID=1490495 RepID=A0A9W7D8H9_9STRA|nr:unnamed protein product [Phytophthora fragariaefolia]
MVGIKTDLVLITAIESKFKKGDMLFLSMETLVTRTPSLLTRKPSRHFLLVWLMSTLTSFQCGLDIRRQRVACFAGT